ncbi:pyrroline-5-carboxylate reductase [Paludibacterium paludis]|uniref:Pyrroline-5-carboxylate reductase n=1 Tax=Paludibacterium paludis TaxID=1225769 RepID=A0A918P149_9NEIS|nr:pyrroline-5-carboxylate reductase [Paludibacterium paludis]GGY12275.1 pyrroline-5-carboxylate reductase [Paludibacterium paludis]
MNITFIGGGNMASAIIGGLVRQGGHRIRVSDRNPDKLAALSSSFGIEPLPVLPGSFGADEIVVLAVKPQGLRDVALELAGRLDGALVVSVAAGIGTEALCRWLGTARVARVMPNTPAMVGKGVSGVYGAPALGGDDVARVTGMMEATGIAVRLAEERGIDDITCVSGSGPAYVFYFMEAMMEAARRTGFGDDEARRLVLATFEGAVALAGASDSGFAQLRANVTSKGGTTERAIARFEAEGVKAAIVAGAFDCRARSVEMGQQLSQD